MKKTPHEVAKVFGCTVAQAAAQMLKNAAQLERMAERAKSTGRKVNNYTEGELRTHAAEYRQAAALV